MRAEKNVCLTVRGVCRSEVSLLSGLNHENIVRLVGFCKNPLSLVMEYLPEGDLLHFLRERKRNEVDLATKLNIALDIAKGTLGLASCVGTPRQLTHLGGW